MIIENAVFTVEYVLGDCNPRHELFQKVMHLPNTPKRQYYL